VVKHCSIDWDGPFGDIHVGGDVGFDSCDVPLEQECQGSQEGLGFVQGAFEQALVEGVSLEEAAVQIYNQPWVLIGFRAFLRLHWLLILSFFFVLQDNIFCARRPLSSWFLFRSGRAFGRSLGSSCFGFGCGDGAF
jgi:hypothetical protein